MDQWGASSEKQLDFARDVEQDTGQEAGTATELEAAEEQLEVRHNVIVFIAVPLPA